MQSPPDPKARHLVLAGGGHSHALVLRMIGMNPIPGVQVTLISDVSQAPYSGMLPAHIAGYYSREEMHIDLRRLCQFAGTAFVEGRVCGIDPAAKQVRIEGRPPLGYDVLSVNTGCTPAGGEVPGVAAFAIPAKPVPRLLDGWDRIRAAAKKRPQRIVIAGGGAGGVELALCMSRQLGEQGDFIIVHRGAQILDSHNAGVRRIMARVLAARRIRVLTDTTVTEVCAGHVRLAGNAEPLPADFTLWVTQAAPASWIAQSGLAADADGFLRVSECLQSTSHPDVFAAGDTASLPQPLLRSGVYAVRMARPLAENLRRYLSGRPLAPYRPQRSFLSLVGTADGRAVASRKYLAIHSKAMWRLKDRIDRRFMRKFSDLPDMSPAPEEPGRGTGLPDELESLRRRAPMRCLGCAAKVGSTILSRTMERLRSEFHGTVSAPPENSGIVTALDAPDDAAVFTVPAGRQLVQTVDYLPALTDDPFLFGKIATLHCFSDIFAMGAEPHSCLAAALLPFGGETLTAERLYQLLSGVITALSDCGAVLLGGHTAESSVIALALTCNGLATPGALMHKGGLRAGDALILTKAAGTGTLFAAHMRLKAKAAWIDAAVESMLLSNLAASRILRAHGATACTDVTGFGIAGHLAEMLRASRIAATLDIDALPPLPGALETIRSGMLSSLHGSNAITLNLIANAAAFSSHDKLPLLFDPQTSGGLLAGLPAARAQQCLTDLRAAGCPDAAIIAHAVECAAGGASITLR